MHDFGESIHICQRLNFGLRARDSKFIELYESWAAHLHPPFSELPRQVVVLPPLCGQLGSLRSPLIWPWQLVNLEDE